MLNCVYVSWSTSELRVRLAPLNWFKPSSKIFYWPFQGGASFVDLLCFCSVLCLLCLCASVYMCFVVTCWERADLLAIVCGVFCEFVTYPGSGVVLDCIDSWSLHLYLLCYFPIWYPGSGVLLDFIDSRFPPFLLCFILIILFLKKWYVRFIILWIFFVTHISCSLCSSVCSLQLWGHLLGKGWPLSSSVCCFFLCFITF